MRIIHFLLLFLISLPLLAQQEYSGEIRDKENSEPLESVLIRSVDEEKVGGISDENGRFRIIAKSGRFEFTSVGYQNQIVELDPGFNQILLVQADGYLNQVVVSGNKSLKKIQHLTISLDIIKPELLDKKNVIKVENMLQQVSSLSITDKQVNIRNSSGWSYGAGSRVMVLQDGMPMLSGDAGQPQWTFINTDNVKNIEVLKGASSLLYGSSALGGIVHIQTATPTDSTLTRLKVFSGIYSRGKRSTLRWNSSPLQQHGIRFLDSRKIDRLDLVSNVQIITDDGYRMGDYEDRLRAGVLSRYHVSDSSQFSLNVQAMVNRSASFLLWESYDSAYNALDGNLTKNKGVRLLVDPKYMVYHKGGKQLIQARYFRIINNINNDDPTKDQSNGSHVYYGEYQIHHKFSRANIKSVAGLVVQKTVSSAPLFQGDHQTSNQAAFIQLEKKLSRLIINGGARYERYTLDAAEESKPVFRIGTNYQASKATFLRASFGQGYRFPTIAESYILTSVGDLSIFPNDTLRSEFGHSIELALKQGWRTKNSSGYFDIALFRMRYDDMMEFSFSQWSTDGFGLGFKSINIGATQITGIEVSGALETKIGKGSLKAFGGYTYTNPISLEPERVVALNVHGLPLSYDSTSADPSRQTLKYRYRHLVRLDMQYEHGAFQVGLSTRYNSFMENIDRAFVSFPINIVVPGVADSRRVNNGGDLLFDLRLVYSPGKLEYGINILNLMNREVIGRPADMGPPRYTNASIKMEF
jgi:outer membrane receptor for ferrienterochelin and colicins